METSVVHQKCQIHFVVSEGGGKPHIVTRSKRGVIVCDEACLGWKSQKVCYHVLATAEKIGCLKETTESYRRLKQPISYTAALTHGFSKNVGKKQGTTSKHKGAPNVCKPDIQMYADSFSSSCMDSGQDLPSESCHHVQSLRGEGCSRPSFPETSFHSHPTPVNATQVTNVSTSQVTNSLTIFIPGTSVIPHTVASFTPAGSTASFGLSFQVLKQLRACYKSRNIGANGEME